MNMENNLSENNENQMKIGFFCSCYLSTNEESSPNFTFNIIIIQGNYFYPTYNH